MVYSKLDALHLVLQPYVLDILNAIKGRPKRFTDLKEKVKNERTLSLKLSRLKIYGLIEAKPIKYEGKYVNSYAITRKGKELLQGINKIV